jgi:WD40 repeat protein
VVFSPDGKRLASAAWETTAKVWDADNGQEIQSIKVLTTRVRSVAFSPDGRRLAGACEDGAVRVWDVVLLTERPADKAGQAEK